MTGLTDVEVEAFVALAPLVRAGLMGVNVPAGMTDLNPALATKDPDLARAKDEHVRRALRWVANAHPEAVERILAASQSDPDATEREALGEEWFDLVGDLPVPEEVAELGVRQVRDVVTISRWLEPAVEAIIAARLGEGVEEWGVDYRGATVVRCASESAARAVVRFEVDCDPRPTLVRRTVTTGEWTEVDE